MNWYESEGDLTLRDRGVADSRFFEKRAVQVRGVSVNEVRG